VIQYYRNITSPENTKVHHRYMIRRDIHNKSWEMLTSSKKGPESQSGEELGGIAAAMIQASTALRLSRKDPLRTLISYSKATKVRSLGSGHENPRLSDATLRVHIIKPNGVHNRHTCCNTPFLEYVLRYVFWFFSIIFLWFSLYLFLFYDYWCHCFVLDPDSWTRSQP